MARFNHLGGSAAGRHTRTRIGEKRFATEDEARSAIEKRLSFCGPWYGNAPQFAIDSARVVEAVSGQEQIHPQGAFIVQFAIEPAGEMPAVRGNCRLL